MGPSDVFSGRSAVITGGASGIGLALGRQLVARGARVTLADIDGEAAAGAAEDLAGDGSRPVWGRELDVRDERAFRAVVDEVVARDGRIDLLFNNAGISMGGPTVELTAAHWDRIIDVNLKGVVNGVLAAYPRMVDQGHGHIVNTASGVGLVGAPFTTAYAATKHAVVGLSTSLRAEAALHGVVVSVLCPGSVETPILDRPPDDELPTTATRAVTAREYVAVIGLRPSDADEFARRALRGVERRRAIIVEPPNTRPLWYLYRLSPRLTDRIIRSIARRVDRKLLRPNR